MCDAVWFPAAARPGDGRGYWGCRAHRHGIRTTEAAPIHRPRHRVTRAPAVYPVQSSPRKETRERGRRV